MAEKGYPAVRGLIALCMRILSWVIRYVANFWLSIDPLGIAKTDPELGTEVPNHFLAK